MRLCKRSNGSLDEDAKHILRDALPLVLSQSLKAAQPFPLCLACNGD